MNILFVTLGEQSSGDMTIAVEFARRLDARLHRALFISAERGRETLAALGLRAHIIVHDWPANPRKNKSVIDAVMAEFRPDLIIAGDIFTCEYSYEWTGLNLERLEQYGLPIASFDQYEYFPDNYTMDYYGGFKTTSPDLVSRCHFILRNCPPNRTTSGDDRRIFTVSLFGAAREYTPAQKRAFLAGLDGDPRARTVFLASSSWESIDAFRFPALFRFINTVSSLIFQLLADAGIPLNVIHVGAQNWESSNRPSFGLRYRNYPALPPDSFELALASSDIFLTMNRISVTLSKAVFLGVPTLLLMCRKAHRFTADGTFPAGVPAWFVDFCRYLKVAYPFDVFPFGWSLFLRRLFRQNDYTASFLESDVFDYHASMLTLKALLLDEGCRHGLQEKQAAYVQSIAGLDGPDAVIEKMAARIGAPRSASVAAAREHPWTEAGQ